VANDQGWIKRRSVSAILLVLIAMISAVLIFWLRLTTVVLVIRHAERNDAASCNPPESGPPLSSAGQTRAQLLVHVAEEAGVVAIYASEFCRTQQTVQPLATQLGLPVTVVDQVAPDGTADVDALIAQIWANNKGQVAFVAGHTNTVPVIIEKLGGGTIAPIGETKFDNLYVVTIPRWGRTKVVHLKYGTP
jgi:phosphohistidine phosphatase SixA